jgi:hypothetical protein
VASGVHSTCYTTAGAKGMRTCSVNRPETSVLFYLPRAETTAKALAMIRHRGPDTARAVTAPAGGE